MTEYIELRWRGGGIPPPHWGPLSLAPLLAYNTVIFFFFAGELRWTARDINKGVRHKSEETEDGEVLDEEDKMSRL